MGAVTVAPVVSPVVVTSSPFVSPVHSGSLQWLLPD